MTQETLSEMTEEQLKRELDQWLLSKRLTLRTYRRQREVIQAIRFCLKQKEKEPEKVVYG